MGSRISLSAELTNAKIKQRPLIIVEGVDDKKFYENILTEILDLEENTELKEKCRVVPIEMFTAGSNVESGCTAIVGKFEEEEIQKKFERDKSLEEYCVGIIDGDSFEFSATLEQKNKREQIKGIFTLKYYSYECYGLTKRNISKVICSNTRLSSSDMSYELLESIYGIIRREVLSDFYYVGLECLRNIEPDYTGIFKYGDGDKQDIYGSRKYRMGLLNKEMLHQYALEKGLQVETNDDQRLDLYVKKIAKGKYLLKACAEQIKYIIETNLKCCESAIEECAVHSDCVANILGTVENKNVACKWKCNAKKLDSDTIYEDLIYSIDLNEVNDIISQFVKLKLEIKPKFVRAV